MTKKSVALDPSEKSGPRFDSVRFLFRSTGVAGGKKMSRAAGWAPASAARGMATTFYCGKLLLQRRALAAATLAAAATLGIFGRLEVTHINFIFLFFAHYYLS